MAANTSPVYPALPASWHAHLDTANTARDGTGTIVDLAQGGTNGAQVASVSIKPTGTTRQGTVRFWLKDGSTYALLDEVQIPPLGVGAAVPTQRRDWPLLATEGPLLLGPGVDLAVSTHVADTFDVTAQGGSY